MLITKFDPDMDQEHPVSIWCRNIIGCQEGKGSVFTVLHPLSLPPQGHSDPEYRKRRAFISELAFRYKQ